MSLEYFEMYNSSMFPYAVQTQYENETSNSNRNKKIDKQQAINELRNLINTKARNLSVPLLTDEFLLRFLQARKMVVEDAFRLTINYISFRNSHTELLKDLNVNDHLVQNAFQEGLPCVLKNRDRRGRLILMFLIYQWDPTKYPLETIYRSLVLTMEHLLKDAQNRVNGFVFIVDWTNFKFRDYVDQSLKFIKLMVEGFQDSFPAKMKAIHFIGQPWYVDGILTIAKTFLSDKTKRRLMVHGTNLSSLHEHLPLDVLPAELGGEGPTYKPDEWVELLRNSSSESENY